MPAQLKTPKFQDVKPIVTKYDSFGRGLNTLVNATKIRDDELSVASNVVFEDEGSPTRRPGSANFGNASGNGSYGLFPYYSSDGTNQLLKMEDGFLKKYNNGDYDIVSGASFASGQRTCGVLAFDTLYLVNGVDALAKYDGTSVTLFTALSAPGSNWVQRGASLTSGQYLYSYRVTAVNNIGETLAAAAATVASSVERDLWNPDPSTPSSSRAMLVNWNTVSGALGYNIYGVKGADETYIGHVDGENVSSWTDYGTSTPSNYFPVPVGNSTAGVKGKFIIEFKSSLLIGGDPDNPSRVYYSAGVDKIDSFLISDGGGYVDISKNSDDGAVMGLAKYQNTAVALKERSVWQLDFSEGIIPSVRNIVNDIGCVSHFTIRNVENDLFFLGRKVGGGAAIYVLGNEPQYLNVLRTNELSTRVRPELQAISSSNLDMAIADYYNGRYAVFYPEGGSTKNDTAIVYDRERLGFTKWTGIYANVSAIYYNESGQEYWLVGDGNDGRVTQISDSLTTDKGSPIVWAIRIKESDLGEPFLYKKYKWINVRLRNVAGRIKLKVITDGVRTAYESSISAEQSSTAYRGLFYRLARYRRTSGGAAVDSQSYVIRRIPISRQGTVAIAKSIALELSGETVSSKATLLDVIIEARPKSKNFYPRSEVISV